MKNIAFFNNKGGVGKTSLVYHLAWMFGELDRRVVAVDLDPQANLSGMFLGENQLEEIWGNTDKNTIDDDIAPLFDGTGDIAADPHIEKISERIGLLTGNLKLSNREDDLSGTWSKCVDGEVRAFRVTTAFARLIASAAEKFAADVVLVDVGPNLGAINRAALIASDYVVIPIVPDLFSLQGLRNAGPMLVKWRNEWQERLRKKPAELNIDLPAGKMTPLGYVVMRHNIRSGRPVQAYWRWIKKIPTEYREHVLAVNRDIDQTLDAADDKHKLAHLKDYYSLMPMAQEANKPMFMLKPADGVIGAHQNAAKSCYYDFRALAEKIAQRI